MVGRFNDGWRSEWVRYVIKYRSKISNGQYTSISNADARCNDQDRYLAMPITTRVGLSDGAHGTIALADKRNIKINEPCKFSFSADSCVYYKVKIEPNKLATIVEIASNPGEGKCYFTQFGSVGVICPAYNWDYRKNHFKEFRFTPI